MLAEQYLLLTVVAWSLLAVGCAWLPWPRWQPLAIAACGAGLLLSVSPIALPVLGAATIATHALHARRLVGKRTLTVCIILTALLLAGFVMLGHHFARAASGVAHGLSATRVVLPLGLAFFCLRWIHYLFESYKGTLREHTLAEYCCYQFLPSALPAGPIHRFDEFQRDLRRKRWDSALFSEGTERVLYGLVKVVVIGNYVLGERLTGTLAELLSRPTAGGAYLSALVFWIKLYVMFSGFSDIAIGFAAAMGFRLRENFNWPFLARNIREFWQRWHNSLASWCRDYVFTPVLSATRSQATALIAAMVVLGLWHDLSLRYVIWGAYHGAGLAVFRRFDAWAGPSIAVLPRWLLAPWRVFGTVITLNFVVLSFPITSSIEKLLLGGA